VTPSVGYLGVSVYRGTKVMSLATFNGGSVVANNALVSYEMSEQLSKLLLPLR